MKLSSTSFSAAAAAAVLAFVLPAAFVRDISLTSARSANSKFSCSTDRSRLFGDALIFAVSLLVKVAPLGKLFKFT